jgi:RNA polymerase sigma-54 factor
MSIGPRLEFRQSQSLVMTPQLRQAIKLLQFSNLEVAAYVEEELERNPLLEHDERPEIPAERASPDLLTPTPSETADSVELVTAETLPDAAAAPLDADFDGADSGVAADNSPAIPGTGGSQNFESDERGIDELVPTRPNLRDHLGEQLRLAFADRTDRMIGAHLIALLEPSGRLSAEPADIARVLGADLARLEQVRARMMAFDPVGMFARTLAECLAAQLRDRNRLDPCMVALLDNLELLAKREHRRLSVLCGVDAEDLADMIAEIRALDPKPGASWESFALPPVIPDVLMRAAPIPRAGSARTGALPGDPADWILELNPETMPRVLVNEAFAARVSRGGAGPADRETRAFVSERLATANWLVKSLQQRAQTILKVSAEIVRRQDAFFTHGVSHLRPLILRDIADAVQLHESTVSRVTANKYISTPRGIFELKYFFTTAIAGAGGQTHSAEAVRFRIRAMVGAETAEDVLSDDAIVAALRHEGVDIARRTVAKYREALRIPSSLQRKREKAVPA